MNIKDSDLVRVRNFGELRPGMTVVSKNCSKCGRTHCRILLRAVPATGGRHPISGIDCCAPNAWTSAPPAEHVSKGTLCFCRTIREGRLYRLRDLDKADELRREQADRETDPAYRI